MLLLCAVSCARQQAEDALSSPRWSLTERRFITLAYQAKEADEAVRVLRFLVREFEIEAKRPNPEDGIQDAVWITRLRLAAATQAAGERNQALALIDQSVRDRLKHEATPAELSSERKGGKEVVRFKQL